MRKAIPLLFLVCVIVAGSILAGQTLNARAHGRVRKAVDHVTARHSRIALPSPTLRPMTPAQAPAGALPATWKDKAGAEREFNVWADAHGLTLDQRQAITLAIADARANREIEQRVLDGIPPSRDARERAAHRDEWYRVRMGDSVSPELFATVERVAGKAAADSFAEEFTGVLPMLLSADEMP